MLVQLPAETWIEILDWLKRLELLKKLDKLWDRQFTPIVQDWLHKYSRNVKIGTLWTADDGLRVLVSKQNWDCEIVPYAEAEIPKNVTSFKRITIKYVDFSVLTLLQQMRPLFHKVCLMVNDKFEEKSSIQYALRLLMPMISSIESVVLDFKLIQFFSTNYSSTLSNAKLLEILGDFKLDASSELLINWLFTPREDGQPRTLVLFRCEDSSSFLEKIRQHFLDSTRQCACPFFIRFWAGVYQAAILQNIPNIENIRTGEQLTFKTVQHDNWHYGLITNCPMNTSVELLDKKTAELFEWTVGNVHQAIMVQSPEISPQFYAAEDATNQQQSSGSGKKLI